MNKLKAPFPYFGGKSKVADLVWDSLGNPDHYLEPFFGSGAVLLKRPQPFDGAETVCDKDGFLANVWRSIQFNPQETAKWCDWPVIHLDLIARKKELGKNEERLLKGLMDSPTWCDPVLAGYWIWAASCSICTLELKEENKIPHLYHKGKGVHKDSISKIPHLTNKGQGIHKVSSLSQGIHAWLETLSERLRRVRVVCGDWTRICGGNWQNKIGVAGIFFDPPYGVKDRNLDLYNHDSSDIAKDVFEWCLKRGDIKTYRIVLAGYEEHEELIKHGWRKKHWIANGGYANRSKGNNDNRFRETLYFSPHCVESQLSLFAE